MKDKIKVAIGSDHAGFLLKESLKEYLESEGIRVTDLGTDSDASVDYTDYAEKVARSVALGEADRGVLVCGTGIGMSIAANRVKGVRAALVTSNYHAEMAARHNNANVIAFGGKTTSTNEAVSWLKTWLNTGFEGGRHARRVGKIDKISENPK